MPVDLLNLHVKTLCFTLQELSGAFFSHATSQNIDWGSAEFAHLSVGELQVGGLKTAWHSEAIPVKQTIFQAKIKHLC